LKPWELWKFTPRELDRFAREKRIETNEGMIRTRYETAILCAYTVNSSGTIKTSKSPDDIYRKMKIKTIEEQEKSEKKAGERRFYKGSLSSQFQQHAEWLESQK
jgi:phosphoribosyl-dephospho-CoA transferase